MFYKYKYTNVFSKYKDKYSHIVYLFFWIFSIHKTQLLKLKHNFNDTCRSCFFLCYFLFGLFCHQHTLTFILH